MSMGKIEPFPGERLILMAKPHSLAFWHLNVISGLLVCLGFVVKWLYSAVGNYQWLKFISNIPSLGRYNITQLLIYWTVLVGFAIIIGLVYIRITPLLLFGSIAAVGTILSEYLRMPLDIHMWLLVFSGLMGFVLTELYRQGHSYYITSLRLIMQKSFISNDSRQLSYRQISDISVTQGLLGKIFDFGTVIPVTVSGMGLGQDSSIAGLSSGVAAGVRVPGQLGVGLGFSASGGRAVQLPRGRTYHTLYGVSHPDRVAETVAQIMFRK
ncbi:MAG: PH domain-containing protein [archaeon]